MAAQDLAIRVGMIVGVRIRHGLEHLAEATRITVAA